MAQNIFFLGNGCIDLISGDIFLGNRTAQGITLKSRMVLFPGSGSPKDLDQPEQKKKGQKYGGSQHQNPGKIRPDHKAYNQGHQQKRPQKT
jgi:hypothetical protein